MRFTIPLLAGRSNALKKEPVPFQEILPLKLKPVVSGKGDNTTEVCCIQEMSVMLSCFKANEFDQSLCPKEIGNFKKCYMDHLKEKQIRKEREEKGILTPGERKMTHKQINQLLRKYPSLQ